eukprot:6040266-Amphidinium_carterae.1
MAKPLRKKFTFACFLLPFVLFLSYLSSLECKLAEKVESLTCHLRQRRLQGGCQKQGARL